MRREQAIRARLGAHRSPVGAMAAEVKHQNMLKCFQQSHTMTLLARIIDLALGRASFVDLHPARMGLPSLRVLGEAHRSLRRQVPLEFVCRGPVTTGI